MNIRGTALDILKHVGIIPDGNRRWSEKNGLSYLNGYMVAAQKMRSILEHLLHTHRVRSISIYGLSKENLQRDPRDLETACRIEARFCNEILLEFAKTFACKVIHAGLKDGLPDYFVQAIENICSATQHYKNRTIYMLINYNPWDELNQRCPRSLDIELTNLWVPEYVDLIIRSAEAIGTSNFLPLQSGYATFFSAAAFFQDIQNSDIDRAVDLFKATPRMFGK
ncbi:MAG: undecaprenyl diphosphate synthase family protein [Pseudomonadota bacterium]